MTRARDTANIVDLPDAKGDLYTATAADTPARLAVGNNGETLVADSSTSTGLRYTSNFAAGKNAIINGAFNVWQRGTSFTNPSAGAYLADRFGCGFDGSGATRVYSQQTFTPGTAPVSGYESQYFLRLNQTVAGTGGSYNLITQPIEDVRTFAGQTVTISFWAKAAAGFSFGQVDLYQYFGSGGSAAVTTAGTTSDAAVTTSWKRFVYNVTVPSISGKTVGSGSYVQLRIWLPTNTTFTFDIWGVQVEAGSVATAFQTATGTIQGELAACQRYFEQVDITQSRYWLTGYSVSTGGSVFTAPVVAKRTTPTITVTGAGTAKVLAGGGSEYTITSYTPTMLPPYSNSFMFQANVASGLTGGQANTIYANGGVVSYQFSAEL